MQTSPFTLSHQVIANVGANRTAFVLHGALGSAQNFRGFVKKLSDVRSDYSYVLVDLRNHGSSHPAPGPNTLEQCARDLIGVVEAHPELPPLTTLIGHSFGGKVAIEFARSAPASNLETLEQVWILDSNPGPQSPAEDHEVLRVVSAVKSVPLPIPNRQHVVQHLMSVGMSSGLANWMTTNIAREGNEYRWVFDLDGIVELLGDYFGRDLWPFLEQPRSAPEFHMVVAERSDRWNGEMTARARALGPETRASVHILENAGHWVHVDNPEGLLQMLSEGLRK
jgi:esterase